MTDKKKKKKKIEKEKERKTEVSALCRVLILNDANSSCNYGNMLFDHME
jgi:ATP-dependent Clp protease adapter protein ClpS